MSSSSTRASDEVLDLPTGLLQALHLLTRDGKLNQDARRKIKQIRHLFQLLEPGLNRVAGEVPHLSLYDMGAGKSYLGFILYELYFRNRKNSRLISVESRPELVAGARSLARDCGYDRMGFFEGRIIDAAEGVDGSVEVVTALHACDTATDEALLFALRKNARFIAVVPCCQAEIARQLEKIPERSPLQALWRHPLQRREFGAHLTNVVRALFLEAQGYRVRVTELVGWEHSMKNEIILAEKIQASNAIARRKLERLLEQIAVTPWLFTQYSLSEVRR